MNPKTREDDYMTQIQTFIVFVFTILNPLFASEKISMSEMTRAENSDCSEVRLDESPGLMANIPIQDQSGTGFCWSYASSQLLDAWRAKYPPPGTPPWTSPDALAFEYMSKKGITDPDAPVNMFDFLKQAPSLKSCDYSLFNNKRFDGKKDFALFKRLEELHRLARTPNSDPQLIQAMSRDCFAGVHPSKQNLFNINEIKNYATSHEWISFTQNILSSYCEGNNQKLDYIPQPDSKSPYTYVSNNGLRGIAAMQKAINSHLNKYDKTRNPKVLPIGVDFCAEILNRPLAPTMNKDGRLDSSACVSKNGKKQAKHSAVIVGRRPAMWVDPKNPNRKLPICQYLIRNSYGTSCKAYPPSDIFQPADRCAKSDGKESGQIWVDEISLLGNSDAAYFFPER